LGSILQTEGRGLTSEEKKRTRVGELAEKNQMKKKKIQGGSPVGLECLRKEKIRRRTGRHLLFFVTISENSAITKREKKRKPIVGAYSGGRDLLPAE